VLSHDEDRHRRNSYDVLGDTSEHEAVQGARSVQTLCDGLGFPTNMLAQTTLRSVLGQHELDELLGAMIDPYFAQRQ